MFVITDMVQPASLLKSVIPKEQSVPLNRVSSFLRRQHFKRSLFNFGVAFTEELFTVQRDRTVCLPEMVSQISSASREDISAQ